MKRFFFSGFALGITLLLVCWWGFFETVLDWDVLGGGGSTFTTEEQYESPDGNHTAYRFIESGGGAAGWGYRCVSIDGRYSEEYEVFRIVPAQTELELNWINTNTLSITYEISAHTTVWCNQPQCLDGVVTVLFEAIH
jgi:hypothetical protein